MSKLDDGQVLALGAAAGIALIGALTGRGGSANMETHALSCAPQAHPGLHRTLSSDEILVYRTSRSAAETRAICDALARGRPDQAFRASVHLATNIAGHNASYVKTLKRASDKGKVPLFTSPYVTTAAIYRDMTGWVHGETRAEASGADPVTWAIAVPRDAVVWTNARTYNTNGIFHTLTYSDAEEVIDARAVRRIWHVPAELVHAIARRTEVLAKENKVKAGFRNAWKDRDEHIAQAALDAVIDLRVPPTSLGRPFLEAPVPLPNGAGDVKLGDRVLLLDGQVATLAGNMDGKLRYFQTKGFVSWAKTRPSWGWDGDNVELASIVRPIAPKEVVKAAEREATWRNNRGALADLLRRRVGEMHGYVAQAQAKGDTNWRASLEAGIAQMEALLPRLRSDAPPWKKA